MQALRSFVPKGQSFIIQCIGHEKCVFPLAVWSAIVTAEGVEYRTLED